MVAAISAAAALAAFSVGGSGLWTAAGRSSVDRG